MNNVCFSGKVSEYQKLESNEDVRVNGNGGETRRQEAISLVDVAREAFHGRRYDEVTTTEIANRACVSWDVICGIFGTKRTLVISAYSEILRRELLLGGVGQLFAQQEPQEEVRTFIAKFALIMEHYPALVGAYHESVRTRVRLDELGVDFVDIDTLAKALGVKVLQHRTEMQGIATATAFVEMILVGMVGWLQRNPKAPTSDAANLALRGIL